MSATIDVAPDYPLARFTTLPAGWTGYTSAAALCLVLPIFYRRKFPAEARAVLLAGLDRYAGAYNEGDVAELVERATAYLAANLDAAAGHTLGQLREMLRLHAGRLLEGRSREDVSSAIYLATYVLSKCGGPASAEELWVLNEAILTARPISSYYQTIDGHNPAALLDDPQFTSSTFGSSTYVRVPIGSHLCFFKLTQIDSLVHRCFVERGYGLLPSWSLDEQEPSVFEIIATGLNHRIYPALLRLEAREPEAFRSLPLLLAESYATNTIPAAAQGESRALLEALPLRGLPVMVRVFEFIVGELRRLPRSERGELYDRVVSTLDAAGPDPGVQLLATVMMSSLGLGARALEYPHQYFMPAG